jgi:hypothetical protein
MSTAFPEAMPESDGEIKIPKDGGAGGIRTGWGNLLQPLVSVPAHLAPPNACRYECNVTAIFLSVFCELFKLVPVDTRRLEKR